MVIDDKKFKASLSDKFIRLLNSEKGLQSKLSKSIGKKPSFFSEIKRGKPVNALHLKAVDIVYGSHKVAELLSIDTPEISDKIPAKEDHLRRIADRTGEEDTREGILSLFQDKEKAREAILKLAEIERADKAQFIGVTFFIQGVCSSLDIKKSA